jgi:hypothetical protein
MASGTFTGQGQIAFDHTNRYGMMTQVAYGPHGIID